MNEGSPQSRDLGNALYRCGIIEIKARAREIEKKRSLRYMPLCMLSHRSSHTLHEHTYTQQKNTHIHIHIRRHFPSSSDGSSSVFRYLEIYGFLLERGGARGHDAFPGGLHSLTIVSNAITCQRAIFIIDTLSGASYRHSSDKKLYESIARIQGH